MIFQTSEYLLLICWAKINKTIKVEITVNQDDNNLVKRKRQIPEIPKKHGFLDEKVQTLKGNRSTYIGNITYNINKISKYLSSKSVERDKIYLCIEELDKYIQKIKAVSY